MACLSERCLSGRVVVATRLRPTASDRDGVAKMPDALDQHSATTRPTYRRSFADAFTMGGAAFETSPRLPRNLSASRTPAKDLFRDPAGTAGTAGTDWSASEGLATT